MINAMKYRDVHINRHFHKFDKIKVNIKLHNSIFDLRAFLFVEKTRYYKLFKIIL